MTASGRTKIFVDSLVLATVAVFSLAMVPGVAAQVHGVPASVTSIGFGGNFSSSPGVPASVTSIGPRGFGSGPIFQPSFNQPFPGNQHLFPHHRHQGFFPGGIPVVSYGIPYAYPVEVPVAVQDDSEAEDYNGGPTIFDRRGPGPSNRQDEERYTARNDERDYEPAAAVQTHPDEPVANQPDTTVVFKDGHSIEVSNYAIIGSTLYDLTPGHPRKILLSDIDVAATSKQNDDRGIDFKVPVTQ